MVTKCQWRKSPINSTNHVKTNHDFPILATRGFHRVCYFASWAMKRVNVASRMEIEDIDPFMCTHLICMYNYESLEIQW